MPSTKTKTTKAKAAALTTRRGNPKTTGLSQDELNDPPQDPDEGDEDDKPYQTFSKRDQGGGKGCLLYTSPSPRD